MLRPRVHRQSQHIARQLEKKGLTARTVKLKLRWADFTTLTRQITVDQPTDDFDNVYENCVLLFESVWKSGKPVRLLGVGVSGLGAPARQLTLWEAGQETEIPEKERRLMEAIQELRVRFGDQVIRQGDKEG